MGLSALCSRHFGAQVRSRGDHYFRTGKVKDIVIQGSAATALVRGSDSYAVNIDWSPAARGLVAVSCDCPYFDCQSECKHVWATLLALDAKDLSPPLSGVKSLRIVDMRDGADSDDLDAGFVEYVDPMAAWVAPQAIIASPGVPKGVAAKAKEIAKLKKARPRKPPAKVVPPSRWKQDFELLEAGRRNVPTGSISLWDGQPKFRQITYAIDVTGSQSRHVLVLRLLQQEKKRNGEFGKPTKFTLDERTIENYYGTPDYPLLEWLLVTGEESERYHNYYYRSNTGLVDIELPAIVIPEILPRLAATGRLVWGLSPQPPVAPGDLHPITWDSGAPWHFELVIDDDPAAKCWRLRGVIAREGEPPLPLESTVLVTSDDIVLWPDRAAPFAYDDGPWIELLRQRSVIEVPYLERDAFLKRLFNLSSLPRAARWPVNLQVNRVEAEPRGHLAIRNPKYQQRAQPELVAKISFDYNGQRIRWSESRAVLFTSADQPALVRDIQAEKQLVAMLTGLGVRAVPNYGYGYGSAGDQDDIAFPAKLLPDIVARLPVESWIVEAEGNVIRRAGEFKLNVTSVVDWFELDGEWDFGGVTAKLPEILAAVRKGEKYVRLGDGTQGLLPQKWLDKYGALADLAEEKDGKLTFKPTQAMLLDALLASQPAARIDEQFAAWRQKLNSFAGVEAVDPPASFTGELRPYQREGLGWLNFLREFQFGGCLADDMGLGKTVQVLALLEERRTRKLAQGEKRLPSLVVVPRSLIFNWQNEAARFAPNLRVLNFSQPGRNDLWKQMADHDVVLCTYGTLLRDITKLHKTEFDYAILDEAQAIKNAGSQSAKACRLLSARHRLAMTGTPIENHLGELWSLLEFLNPGMLGRAASFAKLTEQGNGEDHDGRQLLAKAVQPFVLRRTKQQVLKDLPEKTEQTIFCDLSTIERKKYNELRDFYRASLTRKIDTDGLEKSKIHVLEALLRLRQISCHLGLLDDKLKKDTSAKLDALLEHVNELMAENHKALIFSQFTQLLGIVRHHLDGAKVPYEYLDGKTRDRQKHVDNFQNNPDIPLFLVSLKAGGRGLNLTAADYVFILDPWWNPAVEAQAIDRAHRIGQTQPVFAYRLIARDTVEEKIIELQKSKRELADAIISADSSVLKNLTADDLRMLLG